MNSIKQLRGFIGDSADAEDSIWWNHKEAVDALGLVDELYQAVATGLHSPPDGVGPEGITVHRWEPGHPMGCPICIALDRVEGDHA